MKYFAFAADDPLCVAVFNTEEDRDEWVDFKDKPTVEREIPDDGWSREGRSEEAEIEIITSFLDLLPDFITEEELCQFSDEELRKRAAEILHSEDEDYYIQDPFNEKLHWLMLRH